MGSASDPPLPPFLPFPLFAAAFLSATLPSVSPLTAPLVAEAGTGGSTATVVASNMLAAFETLLTVTTWLALDLASELPPLAMTAHM